jgi:hemerythrin-like domain-containing protein
MLLKIGQRPDHGFDEPLGLLSDCHRRIEHFLQALVTIAQEAAGGPLTNAQRAQLDGSLAYFATAAPRHTADEEESLFPRLRKCSDPAAAQALDVVNRLEHDHADANEHHAAVDVLVRRWLDRGRLEPSDVSELAKRLSELHRIYRAHIAVEDGELFPAAARVLSADDLRAIGTEMAARRPAAQSSRLPPRQTKA